MRLSVDKSRGVVTRAHIFTDALDPAMIEAVRVALEGGSSSPSALADRVALVSSNPSLNVELNSASNAASLAQWLREQRE